MNTKATEAKTTEQQSPKTTPAAFDLASLDIAVSADAGQKLELEHPVTEEGLGIYIILAGSDSGVYRKAQNAISKRRVGKRQNKVSLDTMREEGIELACQCTLGWENVVLDGAELPFSRENAKKLYTRFPWAYEQASGFVHDRSNYLQD